MAICKVVILVLLCSCFYKTSYGLQIAPSDEKDQNPYTINHFCMDTSAISNTVVTILNGTHRLNTTCDIKNANNVTLKAEQGTKVVIMCEDCGFGFLNVSRLKISDIEFRGCGTKWHFSKDYSKFKLPDVLYALVFVNGTSLQLLNVSTIFQGVYIKNVAGNVSMNFCDIRYADYMSLIIVYDNFVSSDVIVMLTNSLITDSNNEDVTSVVFALQTPKLSLLFANTTFSNCSNFVGHLIFFCDLASVTISNATFSDCLICINFIIDNTQFHKSERKSVHSQKLFSIINSNFVRNVGSFYIEWIENSQFIETVLIDIVSTNFSYSAFAIVLEAGDYNTSLQANKLQLNVSISNCAFSNNYKSKFSHYGVITAYKVPYLVLDGITVESNMRTGIQAVQSTIVFSGSTKIANNSALSGGGLKLAMTRLYLAPNTQLKIKDNLAQRTGGGIQIEESRVNCQSISFEPLYYYLDPGVYPDTVNFTISNNHALEGGDNIFGTYSPINSFLVNPTNSIKANSSVSSKPVNIRWNGSLCYITAKCLIKAYPGEQVTFEVLLIGEASPFLAPLVSGSIIATASGAAIKELEKIQKVSLSGSNVTYTFYSAQSKAGKLVIQPTDPSCQYSSYSLFHVVFNDCPLGFNLAEFEHNKHICQCGSNRPIVSNCSIQTQIITKKKDSWLGKYDLNNHSYLATSNYCPYDYCKTTFQAIRSDSYTLYQDEQCQYNRTGILCGSCPEGWSLVLGSSECREECSNVWLLLILPFALAGLLLVAAIHLLNLTVTMGTLSGLIFYVNVMQNCSKIILSIYPIPGLTPIFNIFLSWLNLDIGLSTCFYHGMETVGKTMLLFIFPVYIWLISATVIALSNRYIFFTRLVGENAVKVLSTLLLLSYSKIFHAVINTFKVNLVNVYLNNSISSEMRWAVDGNIPYFDPQRHLALFVIALFFIFLLLPFTMSLLCIRHVYSLSNCCRVFSCVDKLKPFFDTYTGPFKDRAKFWTGLLLLVRLGLIIVHTTDFSDGVIPYYIIVGVCFILSAIMIYLGGVYERQILNVLEYFFILNLGIIFLVNSYKGGSVFWKSIITHLLVSLAFLCFMGIVAYHAYLKFSPFCKKRCQGPKNVDSDVDNLNYERMRGYQPVQQHLDPFTQ